MSSSTAESESGQAAMKKRRNLRRWTIVQQLRLLVNIVRPTHLIAVSVGVFLAISLFWFATMVEQTIVWLAIETKYVEIGRCPPVILELS